MTEMNVNYERWPFLPAPQLPVNRINPLAFGLALICAPFVVAMCTFWLIFIPVIAVPYGLPLYLILGVPACLWAISYRNWEPAGFAFLGFALNAVAALVTVLLSKGALKPVIDLDFAIFYFGFGALFAPAWAFAFAKLYAHFALK